MSLFSHVNPSATFVPMTPDGARRHPGVRHNDLVMMPLPDFGMQMRAEIEQVALVRLLTDLENEARRLAADNPRWKAPSHHHFHRRMAEAAHVLGALRDELAPRAGARAPLG